MIRRFISFAIAAETSMIKWKARNGLNILRMSLGIVFIWFGFLKFFHGLSAAEVIAGKTILKLSFGTVKPAMALPILACWECAIGLGLIFKRWLSFTLILLYLQMLGTMLPLFFFPAETWTSNLLAPTLLGQYIIKNLILVSSGIVIGATVQGGQFITKGAVAAKGGSAQTSTKAFREQLEEETVL
ncbi:hypothetical protein [Mucilaginibacter sp. FT3.2]|uniref:hypothetical protein n=1 Tax=Mucilaginibacter sp. FT3.2 TaxID=2723090 RepID=UPI001608B857|nr:hypothetical protein [Mucilaginibacter sp. FT3.2]MBB6232618.1 putative membrane protein YkgB [Mucilaginibacter sp. FT3.2]